MPAPPMKRLRRTLGRARDRAARRPMRPDERRLLASGLFDPWYYGLQVGATLRPGPAAAEFLASGARAGMLANPFTDFDATGRAADEIVDDLLDGTSRTYPVRDLLDDLALVAQTPAAASHRGGPVGFYLEHAHAGAPVPPIGKRSWEGFRALRQRQSRALGAIVDSGLFDRPYYERQVGRTFASLPAAAWHYLEVGEVTGLSPHPLFEPAWYRRSSEMKGTIAFGHFLRTGQDQGEAGPHFDAAAYLRTHPEAREHPGGPLGHFVATADGTTATVPRPSGEVSAAPWRDVRRAVLDVAERHGAQARQTAAPSTTWARWALDQAVPDTAVSSDEVAILVDGALWDDDCLQALATVTAQEHERWVMHVGVPVDRPVPPAVVHAAATDPRVRPHHVPGTTWADRANALAAGLEQAWASLWNPREHWSPQHLSALLAAADSEQGAHAAVVDTGEAPAWHTALAPRDDRPWQEARGLCGVLLPVSVLQGDAPPFRPEAGDAYAWDLLLRHDVGGPFVPFVAVRGSDLGTPELPPGQRAVGEHVLRAERVVDWETTESRVASRVAGRASALVPTYRDWSYTVVSVARALAGTDSELEVIVVDNGSAREVAGIVAAVFASDPRVHVHRLPRNTHFATASNVAFAHSTGEFAVFLNNDTEAREGWLAPLLEPLADPAVVGTQPLMLYPDDSIQTAGTVFYGRQLIPGHLLASHPPEDCRPGTSLALRAVTAACAAFRAESVAEVRGFDPAFVNGMEDVDLCLRLADPSVPAFRLATASRVAHHESKSPGRFARSESNRLRFLARWGEHLPGPEADVWRRVGFELVGMPVQKPLPRSGRRTAITPTLVRSPARSATDPVTGIPCLRWALKISSPGGPDGDDAPETRAAHGLASLLTDLGQDVVTDRAGAHERPSSDYLDDVVVVLGGTRDARPIPGSVNIMWSADPQEIDPHLWDHVMSGPVLPTPTTAQTLLETALILQRAAGRTAMTR